MDLRFVATDKAETERGTQTFEEVPPEIQMRRVSKGFQDRDKWAGRLSTDAPTLPNDVMSLQLITAQTLGHVIEQGDVEAAFLNGPLMKREVYLRAPREGSLLSRGCERFGRAS